MGFSVLNQDGPQVNEDHVVISVTECHDGWDKNRVLVHLPLLGASWTSGCCLGSDSGPQGEQREGTQEKGLTWGTSPCR